MLKIRPIATLAQTYGKNVSDLNTLRPLRLRSFSSSASPIERTSVSAKPNTQ